MTLSAILSMFIDSITVALFLATVTLELSQAMKFDPVPMILSEIFCANLGGAATMCGDPPNIIIGTSLSYTFSDFITNTGAVVAICFVLMVVYFTLCFRKELRRAEQENGGVAACPAPSTAITNRPAFFASAAVFLLAVVLLITHAQTELSVACIGVIVAVLTMIVSAVTSGKEAVAEIIKGVDYKTLLFFIGLFVSIAGLEETGVLDIIAQFISSVSGHRDHHPVGVGHYKRFCRQYSVCRNNDSGYPGNRRSRRNGYRHSCMDAVYRHRPGRQCNAHWSECQCGWYISFSKVRVSYQLGALLQILCTRNNPYDARVHGIFAFALSVRERRSD